MSSKTLSSNFYKLFLIVVCLAWMSMPAYAIDISTLSPADMLRNLNEQMPNLMRMITAIAYVLGMYFIIHGVIKLKHLGESRTMMSQEHNVMGPIVLLCVGAFLLYLPTAVQVGLSTFWESPNPYGYLETEPEQWDEFYKVCFSIIQFIGVVAFIRGLVILSHLSDRAQQGTFGRGLTHIIGGIFCINIYQTVLLIFSTFGIHLT